MLKTDDRYLPKDWKRTETDDRYQCKDWKWMGGFYTRQNVQPHGIFGPKVQSTTIMITAMATGPTRPSGGGGTRVWNALHPLLTSQ
jgi:hypothetical protein